MCVSNHHLAKGLSGHLQVAKCLGEQYASRFDFKTTSLVNALDLSSRTFLDSERRERCGISFKTVFKTLL